MKVKMFIRLHHKLISRTAWDKISQHIKFSD